MGKKNAIRIIPLSSFDTLVCNIQSALKNGRNCVPRPTALTGYAKPPKKKRFGLSLCWRLHVFGIKVAENE